jgi:hypothetical protein
MRTGCDPFLDLLLLLLRLPLRLPERLEEPLRLEEEPLRLLLPDRRVESERCGVGESEHVKYVVVCAHTALHYTIHTAYIPDLGIEEPLVGSPPRCDETERLGDNMPCIPRMLGDCMPTGGAVSE